jgi:hypothetical protein
MAEKLGLHTPSPSISRGSRHTEIDVKRALKVIAWAVFEVQGSVFMNLYHPERC